MYTSALVFESVKQYVQFPRLILFNSAFKSVWLSQQTDISEVLPCSQELPCAKVNLQKYSFADSAKLKNGAVQNNTSDSI